MMEEFILRIGTDARAMTSGLQRAGAYAKAWGTTLAEDMKSRLGRVLGAGFILSKVEEFGRQTLENIREKILAIHRAQEELPGASSNFIQGLMNQAERLGLSFEEISKPLLKFKQTMDAAKLNPQGKEAENLLRYNIVTDLADLKTQKFSTSVGRLSDAYLHLGKNIQLVADIEGKEAKNSALLSILGLGGQRIESLEKSNFFSDISSKSINLFTGAFGANKTAGQVITASMANLIESSATTILSNFGNLQLAKPLFDKLQKHLEAKGAVDGAQEIEKMKISETLQMEQQRVDVNTKLLELTERRHELEADIADRGKASVAQMAAEARHLTGSPTPRLYTVTDRMRTSLNIDNLERRAQIAYERGDDNLHDKLMTQAQSLRSSSSFLTDKDRYPMRKTEEQLVFVNQQLKPVSEMAAFVNKESGEGSTSSSSKPASNSSISLSPLAGI